MKLGLRSAPASPFGRKVAIAAKVLGVDGDIEPLSREGEDPNPLGKIPCLVLEDGTPIYDSPVILEFLDTAVGGGRIIPRETGPRFEALRTAALADGILDAAILIVYEGRYRPDQEPYEPWLEFQRGKIERSLAALEADPPAVEPVTVGPIGVACALGYLDFRKQVEWRPKYPKLAAWLDDFAAAVPAFEETRPDR